MASVPLAVSVGWMVPGSAAWVPAGMPSITLTDMAVLRLQAVSFFLLGIVLSAWAVRALWNSLRRDFPQLPYLPFGRALAVVVLWGLLFIVVLTMISGARELMTPGAWKKEGLTYKLDAGLAEQERRQQERARFEHLQQLQAALLRHAAEHEGAFPSSRDELAAASDLWEIPGTMGMEYRYVGGLTVHDREAVLVYEPEISGPKRLVLTAGGGIRWMSAGELRTAVRAEAQP